MSHFHCAMPSNMLKVSLVDEAVAVTELWRQIQRRFARRQIDRHRDLMMHDTPRAVDLPVGEQSAMNG